MTMTTITAATAARATTMAKPLPLRPRTTVRAAGLVDVPAVARLIAPTDTGAVPDVPQHPEATPVDWDRARRAMRLMLAHHALEDGQVWVAEREDGTLLAAAVWLPPSPGAEPPDRRFSGLLSRELGLGPQEHPFPSAGLKKAAPDESHWKVAVVGALDDTSAWDHTVAADLLAPGLRAVDEEGGTAVAVTLSACHGDQLRPLGFRRPRAVCVTPGGSVWMTTRQPPRTVRESVVPGCFRSLPGSRAA
ncbi:hypothetical protein QF035_005649 [Streptomyces umbrinus]|uniref:Uncharacterized protein n=1 Tax=Streptomyces umbrinus TaxID=67370 RepID=A0ABU0SWX3_9ACTN|nr:hypothetical protein [Streptomyces umbrinus]MDQ1028067.1 hypothetical protein [Streptomyces umbrinus]